MRLRAWVRAARVSSTGGTTPQKTQRQDRFVVSQADTGGPSSAGSTHAAET